LQAAKFTGEYPLAHIQFEDRRLPVKVELEAFSPFIPHNPDDSGLPVAVLRYRVTNPGTTSAKVGIAFSIDNPVAANPSKSSPYLKSDTRLNEYRTGQQLAGLLMSNPSLPSDDPMHGSFALAAMPDEKTNVTYCADGRKRRGGPRPYCIGMNFRSTANWAPNPTRAMLWAHSANKQRFLPVSPAP